MIERVYLAPMEGVADAPMRKVLTKHGNYDECFSEFIRVTDIALPYKTLLNDVPELEHGAMTESKTNVRVQLLGDNANALCLSAKRAVSLGARSIDMNFGCPSRFVHHAGSMLLKEVDLLHDITSALRDALDPSVHLSIKVRTGFMDKNEAFDIIKAVAVDGVNEIIIHARTRHDLYREEALDWNLLLNLHDCANGIPLVANGDICSQEDSIKCYNANKCTRQMIGRAALMVPNMGFAIKDGVKGYSTKDVLLVVKEFALELISRQFLEKSVLDRCKQFLGFARRKNIEISDFFKVFCRMQDVKSAIMLIDSMVETLESQDK